MSPVVYLRKKRSHFLRLTSRRIQNVYFYYRFTGNILLPNRMVVHNFRTVAHGLGVVETVVGCTAFGHACETENINFRGQL
jgi:hypothetical protein